MSSANDLERSKSIETSNQATKPTVQRRWLWLRSALLFFSLVIVVGFLGYQAELALPVRSPLLSNTYTPLTQAPPSSLGSYDVLGNVVGKTEAEQLLQTDAGREQLSLEHGAVEITDDLVQLGRDAFYRETFGNERFITDVLGSLNGPINLVTITKAIVQLGGKSTSNLQIPVEQDVTIGGRQFKAGTVLNTGMDIPARSLLPLGMRTSFSHFLTRLIPPLANLPLMK